MDVLDWAGWAVFGLLATALLTSVLIGAQLAGLTRMDLPLMLGTILVEQGGLSREEAEEHLRGLAREHRYQRDVY